MLWEAFFQPQLSKTHFEYQRIIWPTAFRLWFPSAFFPSVFLQNVFLQCVPGFTHLWLLCKIIPKFSTFSKQQLQVTYSTLLYPVSLLFGCWDRWSSQKPKYQYRDHLSDPPSTQTGVCNPDIFNQNYQHPQSPFAKSPEGRDLKDQSMHFLQELSRSKN